MHACIPTRIKAQAWLARCHVSHLHAFFTHAFSPSARALLTPKTTTAPRLPPPPPNRCWCGTGTCTRHRGRCRDSICSTLRPHARWARTQWPRNDAEGRNWQAGALMRTTRQRYLVARAYLCFFVFVLVFVCGWCRATPRRLHLFLAGVACARTRLPTPDA